MTNTLSKIVTWIKSHPLPTSVVATILFVTATFGTFPDILERFSEYGSSEEKTYETGRKAYWLGYKLGEYGLVYSTSIYLLSFRDNVLKEMGLIRERLEKLSKVTKTEVILLQSKYDQLGINLNI
jgi:hypothetical protein